MYPELKHYSYQAKKHVQYRYKVQLCSTLIEEDLQRNKVCFIEIIAMANQPCLSKRLFTHTSRIFQPNSRKLPDCFQRIFFSWFCSVLVDCADIHERQAGRNSCHFIPVFFNEINQPVLIKFYTPFQKAFVAGDKSWHKFRDYLYFAILPGSTGHYCNDYNYTI